MFGKILPFLAGSTFLLLLAPAVALAGSGGAPLVIVADTRHLSGIMSWWGTLYNEGRVTFTILTVILIPAVGILFGVLADMVLHLIGIDLSSRDLAEH